MEKLGAQDGARTPVRSTEPTAARTAEGVPSHEAIALLAYEKFCNRGYEHGFAEQDWLAAEQELMAMHGKTHARA